MKSKRVRILGAWLALLVVTCWMVFKHPQNMDNVKPEKGILSGSQPETLSAVRTKDERLLGGVLSRNPIDGMMDDLAVETVVGVSPQFRAQVILAGSPVQNALITHANQQGVTDIQGICQLKKFVTLGPIRVDCPGFPSLLTSAITNNARLELAAESKLSVQVRGSQDGLAGVSVGLFFLPRNKGSATSINGAIEVWRGNLDASGRILVEGVPTPPRLAGVLEAPFFLEFDFPGGQSRIVKPSIAWARNDESEWSCHFEAVTEWSGSFVPGFLLVSSEETGLPVKAKIAYRTELGESFPWRVSETDADGLAFIADQIVGGGRLMVWLGSSLTTSCRGSSLIGMNGGLQYIVPPCPQLSVKVNRQLLKPISLEATSVAWKEGRRVGTRSGLMSGPNCPKTHSWVSLVPGEFTTVTGGWFGRQRGVAVRVLPGGAHIALIPINGEEELLLDIPELALVNGRVALGANEDFSGARISAWSGSQQIAPYYFNINAFGESVFALPVGSYSLWLELPGFSRIDLGSYDFLEGMSEVNFSSISLQDYSLRLTFGGEKLPSGAISLNGIDYKLSEAGVVFVGEIADLFVDLRLDYLGGIRKLRDGVQTLALLGFNGRIPIQKEGLNYAVEIPSGTLTILGNSTIDREIFVFYTQNPEIETPGFRLIIPMDSEENIVLPVGDYRISGNWGVTLYEVTIESSRDSIFRLP